MSGKKPVSDEDRQLFREAVGDVRPVSDRKRPVDKPAVKPVPRSSEQDDREVMHELMSDFSEADLLETGEHLSYAREGIQRSVLRNLKSGKYKIQSELDLHGFYRDEAMQALSRFLADAQARDHTCVRIIHGKGRVKAEREPVLKRATASALRRHRQVVAYCSARENDGGTGALYVLLKRQRG